MKYAIDRYEIGSEKEVSADLFYGKYISRRHGRFLCPECGEPVYWCSRGGSQPDKFSHYNKTELSPECEKRVDGNLKLNLYERVGLPVYLTVRAGNRFCLNIGFPALGEQTLLRAARQGVKACVAGAETQKTISVDAGHFLEDNVTLVPVNFVPPTGKNFAVTIFPREKTWEIRKSWSDYADGFYCGGAIFTYGETEGKKIRKGDAVSPDRQYYVIARYFRPPQEIQWKALGTISLNKEVYQVCLVTICVSTENINRYRYVEKYLQKEFGVRLLQTLPELIPLWPPVTEQGVRIPVMGRTKMFCAVSSGNDVPNVYRYDGTDVFPMPVKREESGSYTVVFPVDSQEMLLSVDRKYAGREVSFQAKEIARSGFAYVSFLEDTKGDLIEWEDFTRQVLSAPFFLNVNARMELYIGDQHKIFRHVAVRERRVAVTEQRNSQEMYFVAEDGVFFHIRVKNKEETKNLQSLLTVDRIRESHGGEWVPLPYWVKYLLLECERMGQEELVREVGKRIVKGRIPVGLLKVLHDFYCRQKGFYR